jgi:hypothetical protein
VGRLAGEAKEKLCRKEEGWSLKRFFIRYPNLKGKYLERFLLRVPL